MIVEALAASAAVVVVASLAFARWAAGWSEGKEREECGDVEPLRPFVFVKEYETACRVCGARAYWPSNTSLSKGPRATGHVCADRAHHARPHFHMRCLSCHGEWLVATRPETEGG